MAPWVTMHAFADGRVYPCCYADHNEPIGNLRKNSMWETWNNEEYKQLRQRMLSDQPSKICSKCYEQESQGVFSMRNSINRSHGKYIDVLDQTAADGSLDDFKLRYWDIRFSNLCNFSCRSCGPVFSSNWYKEHVKMFGSKPVANGRALNVVEYAGKSKTDILEQMEQHLPYIDQIYFAGGEPLIMEEHYAILQRLIELGRTDINIQYNTNFSELVWKKTDVLDLWKHFSTVHVGASLDALGARAELMRRGTDWNQIEHNRRRMIEQTPHVNFYISATVSAMNVLHVMDLHRDWVLKKLIQAQDFHINVLHSPVWYRVDILPNWFKKTVVQPAIDKHLQWLAPQDELTRASAGYRGLINLMMAEDRSEHLDTFRKQVAQLDHARGEDFWSVFPELRVLQEKKDHLCVLPWISLEATPIGTARVCCLSDSELVDENARKYNFRTDHPQIIFNSLAMQKLRQEFRAGGKPTACSKCWAEEDAGRQSKRQNTLIKFKSKIKDVPISQDLVEAPWFLDLKLGNICNLKCRICGSWSSSRWAAEEIGYLKKAGVSKDQIRQHHAYNMLKNGAWPRNSLGFWNALHSMLPNTRYIEFTGGEPFLIEEHFDLLKYAVKHDHAPHIDLHYNTNATVYPEHLESIWQQFSTVEIAFSIDDVGARFEYQRSGAKWLQANENIKCFRDLRAKNRNIELQLCFTVNIHNILYLDQLLSWAEKQHFDSIHWNMLHGPEELSIACLPDSAKAVIIPKIEKMAHGRYAQDFENLIRMMQQGTGQAVETLHARIRQADQYRGEDLSISHPELAQAIGYAKTR